VNDAPVVNPSEAEAYDNAGINLDIEVTDVDDENITLQILDQPKNVSASINGLTLEVDNPNLYWGTDELTISAYDGTDYSETVTISLGFKRNINYNVPSSDFTNNISPWFDLAGIVDGLGFTKKDSYNTNAAYADFNGDNYFDIMIQPNVNDGVPVNTFFLINNGDNTFYIDNDFSININTSAISSRKTIVGDFNLDGKPDVVRPQGGHDWLGKPTITLSNENGYDFNLIESAPEIQAHGLCSGDIDNDGDLDIFFANAGMYDGFAINDGNGNFSWKWITEVIDGMDSGWMYPDGGYGYYGFWTSDMSDIDNDGFVDLILGGTYKDIHYDPNLDGATILWGDGSGSFSFNRATVLFVARELNYINYSNGQKFSTQDFAIADINMDGLKDVALKNPFISSGNFHQVFLSKGDRVFEDVTLNVFNGIFKFDSSNYVWLNLRDLDNNGLIELIEQEPVISVPTYESSSGWRKSFIWEWTGSSFIRRQ